MILFAGPSLSDKAREAIASGAITLRPPVQRQEIGRLVGSGYRGTIAIADGVFHQVIAVGHAEIRFALNNGCRVFGLCSMGAIRAYEMRFLGMEGFGKVYRYFYTMEDFQDDEMALYHMPAPHYSPLSEPMVHFRYCLDTLQKEGRVSLAQSQAVLSNLKARFYGERTLNLFHELCEQHGVPEAGSLRQDFDRYRIKQQDLVDFIQSEQWQS